jgi:hypothetical protein
MSIQFNIINILPHDIDKETVVLNKKVLVLERPKQPTGKDQYKNVAIDYSETPKIRAMRLILACYNLLLRKTHVDIGTAENYYVVTANGQRGKTRCFIDPNSFIHRIFDNSTFNKGGRIYGGWWQKCPSNYKKDILINGNSVIEVTYKAAYLGILYQLEGVNLYDTTAGRDLYDITIPEFDNVTELELANYNRNDLIKFKRFIIKNLIHNGIIATSETGLWRATIKAINSEVYNTNGEIQKPSLNILKKISYKFLASVFDLIKQKHSVVSHYFLAGMAPRLQLIESNMTLNLIEHFTAIKVPILTLHDGYIIEKKWGQTLINAMQCSWIEEMSNLEANQECMPKRSKHLERLTSHENHYNIRHLLSEPSQYTPNSGGRNNKLRRFNNMFERSLPSEQLSRISMENLFQSSWSKWCADIIEIKTTVTSGVYTKRYKTSLKLHQKWLLEGDTEDNSVATKNRYNSFYASINSSLYLDWLRSKPLWMNLEIAQSEKKNSKR